MLELELSQGNSVVLLTVAGGLAAFKFAWGIEGSES